MVFIAFSILWFECFECILIGVFHRGGEDKSRGDQKDDEAAETEKNDSKEAEEAAGGLALLAGYGSDELDD